MATYSDTSAWLVATKLHPPLMRTDTIGRPQLDDALSRSVSTLPLTLLSAPAGYGKTTMLAGLPRLLPGMPLAWVTLDAEDNDPIRFLGVLTAALQSLHSDFGEPVWPLLTGGNAEGPSLKRVIGVLINEMLQYLPKPFIIVLDDLHLVTEPAVYIALEYLLDHQPLQLHIAIGTRNDPPLRLARLTARRQLAELRQPDLGFSQNESYRLLNETLGLNLSDEEVAALQERTEGWPAGLCLLAGPLGRMGTRADRTEFMITLNHTERYALDFFAEEVLRNLPDAQRRFLMQTSILAEMTPSVCSAVTGRDDAGEVLEELYRQNLTIASITEAEGEPVYRHHALFARLLHRQLERELPTEVSELHRRSAQAQKTPGRAIAHYLAAELWEPAAQLMLESGMLLLLRGMAETVRKWYRALPVQIQASHPRLQVIVGRCEIHRGDYAAAAVFLRQAQAACVASGDAIGEAEALTSLITLTYQNDDRAAAAKYVERAMQLPLSPMGQVASRLGKAWLSLSTGDWKASAVDIRAALTIPHDTGDRRADLIGITYMSAPLAALPGCIEATEMYCTEASTLAPPNTAWRLGADELYTWILLWRGQIGDALQLAQAAEAVRQRLGGYPFVGNDLPIILYLLYSARSEFDAAGRAVDVLLERIKGAPKGKWAFYLHAAGSALTQLGRYAEAQVVLQQLSGLKTDVKLTQYFHSHLAGFLALQEGRLDEAAQTLQQASALEEDLPVAWVGGSARLLQARIHLEQGNTEAALALAIAVISEWEKSGTPGCALINDQVVFPLIKLAAQEGSTFASQTLRVFQPSGTEATAQDILQYPVQNNAQTTELNTAIATAYDNSGHNATMPSIVRANLSEPLTQRECDVLRLIVAGNTNRQIAAELFIAQETVKSHVVHILRKLEVSSRTQAAIRGRELGL